MISYKRDVLEKQSPLRSERVRKKIVEYFKIMFLNIKFQRLCKSHHL